MQDFVKSLLNLSDSITRNAIGGRSHSLDPGDTMQLSSPTLKQAIVGSRSPERAGRIAWALHAQDVVPFLAFTSSQILRCVDDLSFDLVVVEEDLDSHDLVAVLRDVAGPRTPILTLVDADETRTEAVTPGADLTLNASTEFEEIARRGVNLVLVSEPVALPALLNWGPLALDMKRRLARWEGGEIQLTSTEFRIMEVLVLAAGGLVTNAQLSRRVWGDDGFKDAERIFAHIRRVRRKIEDVPSHPGFLLTVRGEGYRLADWDIIEPDIDLTKLEAEDFEIDPSGNGHLRPVG